MAKYPKELRPEPTPKRKNVWDAPLRQHETGDEKDSITYEAVGRALSNWEGFECELAALFSTLVGGNPTSVPAIRAYGSVQSFRGRADMIEAAAEAFFLEFPEAGLEKEISDFMTAARGFSARRNEVAHGMVSTPIWNDKKKAAGLFPPNYSTGRNKLNEAPKDGGAWTQRYAYGYTSVEINAFAKHFRKLDEDMCSVRFAVKLHRLHSLKKRKPQPP